MASGKSKTPKETKVDKQIDSENILTYELSDPKFIEMGWTVLSKDKEKEKLVTYQAEPAKIHNVLEERTQEEKRYYKNGKLFVIFKTNGTGRVLYPDGQLAIKVSKHDTGTRMIVLNPSGKDETGFYRQKSLAAMFDSFGNGIIYDISGKVRLKYTQKEGVLFDTPNGLPVPWKWKIASVIEKTVSSKQSANQCHKIPEEIVEQARSIFDMREKERDKKSARDIVQAPKETPVSQMQLMTQGSSNIAQKKSSVGPKSTTERKFDTGDDSAKTSLEKFVSTSGNLKGTRQETRQFVSENNRQLHTRKTFMFSSEKCTPVKIIVLKVNKYIGFRILDQSNISLQFNAGNKILRLELGVRVNPQIEVCVNEVSKDIVSVKDIPCIFEVSPTPSMMWSHNLLHSQQQNAKMELLQRNAPVSFNIS
ncbi:uncharacterized protein LOC126276370 isoform X2 [Schistocerca gregaria]|uniref:uncharacterized protein LOC126276370 isoform X2 n=1 Tax=Schistocerca gregaria TaxID=7010 RepID=UPI00211EB0B7|nr:uncharacterized protein LOC126276370 isoform X2 [Schistocerca gregaria]